MWSAHHHAVRILLQPQKIVTTIAEFARTMIQLVKLIVAPGQIATVLASDAYCVRS